MSQDNKRGKAVKGVVWSAVERFSVQGVQFIVSIILARLLSPEDFGMIAIVIVFSTIFQTINESGFNTALVHKQDRDRLDYSTAFVTNLLIGVISYVLLFTVAPWIAHFYENAELTKVMRILSLNLVINALGLVPVAIYTIRVDFKTQARASLVAAVLSGIVGVVSAYLIRNVYAIVIQQLTYSVIYVALMWMYANYKVSFTFSLGRFKVLFDFASKLIGARLISVVFDDIYSLAIGKLYSPSSLGCYNRAQSFQQVLSKNIINIVQRVSVPMLCEVQNDNQQMKVVLLKFMCSTALVVYPMLAGLMVLSQPLILIILGEQWRESAEMLLFTCPIGFFYLISTFNRNIYNATGRTDLALKTEFVKKIIFVAIFLLTMKYRIQILLLGLIFISIIEMIIDINMVKRQIGLTLLDEIKALIPILFSTLIMSLIICCINFLFESYLLKLSVGFVVGVLSYLSIILMFNVADCRKELRNYGFKI